MFESQYLTLVSKITTMLLGIYLIWFLFVQYSPFGFVSKHILPHLISKSTTCNISKCLHSMCHITHWDPMGLCLLLFPVRGFKQKKHAFCAEFLRRVSKRRRKPLSSPITQNDRGEDYCRPSVTL